MIVRTLAAATAIVLCLDCASARAQTSVTTDPVGFTAVTIDAGSTAALSLPLDQLPSYAAAVSAVTSSTITTASAGWTNNAFGPFSSNPHVVRFLTGANAGREFRITSNNGDTLVLATNGSDLASGIAAGDRYAIFPAATLASLFGARAPALNTSSNSSAADVVIVRESFGWLTYYNDGTQWLREGGGANSENSTALLPESGFLFVRRGNTSYELTVTGAVPTTNLITDFRAAKTVFFANRFPVATTLNDLGLAQQPGWNASSNSTEADNVLIRGPLGWLTYYFDGTAWLREGGGAIAQNPEISVGGAVLVVRHNGSDITLNEARPY